MTATTEDDKKNKPGIKKRPYDKEYEKKRREEQKALINDLKECVPILAGSTNLSNKTILIRVRHYIQELQQKVKALSGGKLPLKNQYGQSATNEKFILPKTEEEDQMIPGANVLMHPPNLRPVGPPQMEPPRLPSHSYFQMDPAFKMPEPRFSFSDPLAPLNNRNLPPVDVTSEYDPALFGDYQSQRVSNDLFSVAAFGSFSSSSSNERLSVGRGSVGRAGPSFLSYPSTNSPSYRNDNTLYNSLGPEAFLDFRKSVTENLDLLRSFSTSQELSDFFRRNSTNELFNKLEADNIFDRLSVELKSLNDHKPY